MAFLARLTSYKSARPRGFFDVFARLIACCAFFAFIFMASVPVQAKDNPRYASIVMDADTGLILSQRHADKKRHPASLVKAMTLMMVFDAIENGDLTLRDRIVISRHAASMVPSKLNLPVGSSIRVEDAIYALVTKSANDVAVAIAEKIAGTESQFAQYMTGRARQIGMKSTVFRNASGLHHPKQVTTARDMALLGQYMIRNYPRYYHYFSTQQFTYRGKTYNNHNRLMKTYSGMDGLKTGYIGASGFNLLASAKRNNRRIIGVVFGGRTSKTRNAHMKKLLDKGFGNLNAMLLARAAPVPERKPDHIIRLAAVEPAVGTNAGVEDMGDWADLNPMLQNRAFQELIGEGDFDPEEKKRFETGFLAIAAVKGVYDDPPVRPATQTSFGQRKMGDWSIQVGAFESRAKTDAVIKTAQRRLSSKLSGAAPVIVPLKTRKGWIFRGRLSGYSKQEAMAACAQLPECLPISPQAR